MKNYILTSLVIAAIVAITFFTTRRYYPKVKKQVVTDTVRVDHEKEIEVIKEVEVKKPTTVTKYKTVRDTVTKIQKTQDTVFVSTPGNIFAYNTRFLTRYPTTPRFLGLHKTNMTVEVSFQKTNGETESKKWNLDHRNFSILPRNESLELKSSPDRSLSLDNSISVGWLQGTDTATPYVELESDFRILGVTFTGSVNVNQNPFFLIGYKYNF